MTGEKNIEEVDQKAGYRLYKNRFSAKQINSHYSGGR